MAIGDPHYQQAAKIIDAFHGYNLWGTYRLADIEFLAGILQQRDQIIHALTLELDRAHTRGATLAQENYTLRHPAARATASILTYLGFLCGLRSDPGDHVVHKVRVG